MSRRRLRELRTGSPDELLLLLVLPGDREEELGLHARFAQGTSAVQSARLTTGPTDSAP